MDPRGVLTEAFGRITELYDAVAEGLDDETLRHRPGGTGNPIGWLLWHLARVQDDHVATLADRPQVWEEWQDRFGLPNGTAGQRLVSIIGDCLQHLGQAAYAKGLQAG